MRTLIVFLLLTFPLIVGAKCRAQSNELFSHFFVRFGSDKDFAINRTLYPYVTLAHEYGVDEKGNDDSRVTKSWVTQEEDRSAPTLSVYRQKNGLIIGHTKIGASKATVVVEKPDTDFVLSYHFKRRGKCWYLEYVEDHSL